MADLRISTYTLGCKLNYAETATVGRTFTDAGFVEVDFDEEADLVLINTCTVTENADREARKIVRRALRRSPNAFVIVTGCFAQLRPERIASIDGVDLILGTGEKFSALELAGTLRKRNTARICVGELGEDAEFGAAFAADSHDRTRAFLKVQDGCDYNCSFCTIPKARGAGRSQDIGTTVKQAAAILERGFREIVLSGVNVGEYGAGGGGSLTELVKALINLPGDFWIRISSIEPNLLNDELIGIAAESGKICQHFHVPLQSGSDAVLRRMRRRYTARQFRERVETLVSRIPCCGVGIDVITGFPGETAECFDETREFLEELPFSYLHVFTYSERPHTHALTLDGKVRPEEGARRGSVLRLLSESKRLDFNRSQLGSSRRTLMEKGGKSGRTEGFTDNYIRISVPYDAELANRILTVRLESIDGSNVLGRVLSR